MSELIQWSKFFKACRKEAGLTQTELSNAVGVTRATITMIETTQYPNPTIKNVIKMLTFFRKDFSDLQHFINEQKGTREVK